MWVSDAPPDLSPYPLDPLPLHLLTLRAEPVYPNPILSHSYLSLPLCPISFLSHYLLIPAPRLFCCISLSLSLGPPPYISVSPFLVSLWLPLLLCASAPLLRPPLPSPQQEAASTLLEALQAVLGFGVWDGSGSGGGDRGAHAAAGTTWPGRQGSWEGASCGWSGAPPCVPSSPTLAPVLPSLSPPPSTCPVPHTQVCHSSPARRPAHRPAVSSGHWPLAPQGLLDPNSSRLRSGSCTFLSPSQAPLLTAPLARATSCPLLRPPHHSTKALPPRTKPRPITAGHAPKPEPRLYLLSSPAPEWSPQRPCVWSFGVLQC